MPTTHPHVPGWHPDPDDPGSLRHWDGERWGTERRPRPSWAPQPYPAGAGRPGMDGAGDDGEPAPTKASRRTWALLAAGALLLGILVISVPAWLGSGPTIPSRSISDAAFTTRADAVCAGALAKLRKDRPEAREDNGTPSAFAARIEQAADGLAAVAAELRAIPVATAADKAEVDRWLDDWDAYTATGHRYAAAFRAQDKKRWERLSLEGQSLAKRIFVFAKANDMPSCRY